MRTLSRLACFALAFLGAVPIGLAAFLTSAPAERWAALQTSLALERELGLQASFDVKVRLLPLRLAIERLTVPASDGGSPFLTAKSASVTPRFFSLLAGKLDLGDIEIDQPDARIVLRQGKLANLRYRLPETKSKTERPKDAPFGSLSIGEGRFRIDVDGVAVDTEAIDLDVFAEPGSAFELALRAGTTKIDRQHAPLVNRFVRATKLDGFVAFAGDVRWDGTHRLPTVQGKLTGGGVKIGTVA